MKKSDPPLHTFLRDWREKAGLSLEQVANMLGVRHTSVMRWEKGAMKLPTERLEALARIYGTTNRGVVCHPDEAALVAELDRMQAIRNGMSEEAREEWLRMGERLAGR